MCTGAGDVAEQRAAILEGRLGLLDARFTLGGGPGGGHGVDLAAHHVQQLLDIALPLPPDQTHRRVRSFKRQGGDPTKCSARLL